jgi:hypothetical protein
MATQVYWNGIDKPTIPILVWQQLHKNKEDIMTAQVKAPQTNEEGVRVQKTAKRPAAPKAQAPAAALTPGK